MRAPLSIIIPTLNAAEELPGALAALMEGVEAGLLRELIVSDGGSADGTLALAQAAGAELVSGPAGRGGQLGRGAAAASGIWLLFVHADSWLAPGWTGAVQAHMAAGPQQAGVFRLAFRSPGFAARFVAGWANLRTRVFGLPYGDQGLLISRDLYEEVGGFEHLPLMEDVTMACALRGRIIVLPGVSQTSAGRYLHDGWLRRGFLNILTLLRFLSGVAPETLAGSYQKQARGTKLN